MKKLQINIFDTNLVWYGMVEEVQSLILHSSWHEIATSELHVSRYAQGVDELLIGRILVINGDWNKAQIIEDRQTTLQERTWVFNLTPLKGIMNWRVTNPTYSSTAWTAKPQAQIMMELVNGQLITTSDPDRKFDHFAVNATKTYGNNIDFKAEWGEYLGETLTTLAKQSDNPIGWNVYIDYTNTQFLFETYQGVDRTINQTVNNPVVFSEDFGNIKDATYSDSIKDWRNVAYVKWSTDATTPVTSYTPYGNTKYGATVSFARKEVYLESDQKTSSSVSAWSYAELNDRPKVQSFSAEVLDNPNTMSTYGVDWNLGDIVTVQSKELGVSIDVQVTEVEEVYEGGQYQLTPTFGQAKLSFIDLIKNAIKAKG